MAQGVPERTQGPFVYNIVNTVIDIDLETQGTRSSAAMVPK